MKKVKVFYMENCPHCRRAFRILDDLMAGNPEYSKIEIEYIDENKDVKAANAHDYYYVPTFYVDGVKLHEGVPSVDRIERVLKEAIKHD
ncbi:MAG TPA: thioredoxin family protein [Sedimentibacter sp.]|mgnify:CR=1 FL=1|jgi:glutaredoxin|nr:thioredoxin family protein [Sedimentibacter sp.]HHZ00426.1 thioredoxin family protein [Tissierellia bacterium]HOK48753.1 thioredoxin family protein [Sedimentibacter sp.]HOW23412.1 thioredoxin family protein [Sedimentibacter sp.]HRC81674.1 thioredoxin family protein [Sedimentibacter sp.]